MTDNKNKEYLFEALGKMLVAFQAVESAIERMIFSCMTSSYSHVGILMSELSFKGKVNVMGSLIKDLHTEDQELKDIGNIYAKLGGIIKNCHQCESRRNQLIHSSWVPGFKSAPELMMRIKKSAKSKKGYAYSVECIDSGELDSDINFANNLSEEIHEFCFKLCTMFDRVHGIAGMEEFADHSLLCATIHRSAISKNK